MYHRKPLGMVYYTTKGYPEVVLEGAGNDENVLRSTAGRCWKPRKRTQKPYRKVLEMMKWCGEVPEIRAENDVKRDQHEANAFWKVLFVVKMVWSMLYVTKTV